MTDYAAILASDAGVETRAQKIADLFNVTANYTIYTDFRLTQVSRASRLRQHVHDLGTAQVDGTTLTAQIATKGDDDADTAPLHTALNELVTRQQQNKPALEKASVEAAELQEVFAVLVSAEQKMRNWSNINLFNIRKAEEAITANAERLREMTDALPAGDAMLRALEKLLQKLEKSITQRAQRKDLAAYLQTGIATGAAVTAPKTARFTRRPAKVTP
jgi:DNA repair exonuclease SbcCD ATPase subunit